MSEIANYEYEFERSLAVFTDPDMYEGFDLTRDRRRILGCIDPRPEQDIDHMKVKVQTTGGGAGNAHDTALVMISEDDEALHGFIDGQTAMVTGLVRDRDIRRDAMVRDVHRGCKFLDAIVIVLEEEADPSEFTKDTLGRWTRQYAVHGDAEKYTTKMIGAAARLRDNVLDQGIGDILETADGMFPTHPNVHTMVGDNRARIHIVNHHPYVGLNRQAVHYPADGNGVVIQAYHDSLAATADSINNVDASPDTRGRFAGAMLLRAAAARTVLGSGYEDMVYAEVYQDTSPSGLSIVTKRLEAAA